MLGEDPSERGPHDGADRDGAGQEPEGTEARLPGHVNHDHRPPYRLEHGRPDSLDEAEPDQEPDPGGEAAEEGGGREDAEPRQVDPAKAVPVSKRAEEDQGRGEGDPVGEADPTDGRERGPELLGEVGERDVHDGGVQRAHEGRDRDQGRQEPRIGVLLRRCLRHDKA